MIDKTEKPGKPILNEALPVKEIAVDTRKVHAVESSLCHNQENETCKGKSCCKGAIVK
jgi:hypothetical protein